MSKTKTPKRVSFGRKIARQERALARHIDQAMHLDDIKSPQGQALTQRIANTERNLGLV